MSQKWEEFKFEHLTFVKMPKGIRLWYVKKRKYVFIDYDLYPSTPYHLTEKGQEAVRQLYYQVANKKSQYMMSSHTARLKIPIEAFETVILKLMEILPANLEEDPEMKEYNDRLKKIRARQTPHSRANNQAQSEP